VIIPINNAMNAATESIILICSLILQSYSLEPFVFEDLLFLNYYEIRLRYILYDIVDLWYVGLLSS
jgi:hypothetical protein